MAEYEAPKSYTATNDSTGDLIKTRTDGQDKYAKDWEAIFGKNAIFGKDIPEPPKKCCGKCGSCSNIDN